MSKTHTLNEQEQENMTLASEIIADLRRENKNLNETIVTLALLLTKTLKESNFEDGDA
jgi:hypothetical protein